MSFYSFLACNDIEKMSVKDLESEIDKLMHQVKIMQCLNEISKNPDYGLELRFMNGGWHFNFCEYFFKHKFYCLNITVFKCNCMDFIISKGIEQLFDIVKNVFDGFNMSVLCKYFYLLDISKRDFQQIDSIKNLLVECKNDIIFLKLHKSLVDPDYLETEEKREEKEKELIQILTMPILEKLKVKKNLFHNLLQKWIKHEYCVNEQISCFPHLLTLYKKYMNKYCLKFIKINDLIKVLNGLCSKKSFPPIYLELQSLYDRKGQILNSEDFMKSLRCFRGCKYIVLKEIVESFQQIQVKDPICFINTIQIEGEKNSSYQLPLHKFTSLDDLFDMSTIAECNKRLKDIVDVKLTFINKSRGFHFSFCPNGEKKNFSYRFCNCLKYICDKKIFDVMEKYAKKFRILKLKDYFEYFNFAFNSQIEVLDEVLHGKEFNDLYEIIDCGGSRIDPVNNVATPTAIMPLLEKLKVFSFAFGRVLRWWKGKYDFHEIFGFKNDIKYPHCMNSYKSLIDESTKCLHFKDLIRQLRGLNINSKIYLEIYNFEGSSQKLEGNKEQVVQEILKNATTEDDICEIKKFKIDDDDEAIYYTIPYTYFVVFDETCNCLKKLFISPS